MFRSIINWVKNHKTLVSIIIAAIFCAAQIPMLINHEVSMDEANIWLTAKGEAELTTYSYHHADPQAILWIAILTPFARIGLPIITMNIISLILTTIAVFLLVRFCKLNWFIKLSTILSMAFLYYNPVIARWYSVIPFVLALTASLFELRTKKPLLYGFSLGLIILSNYLLAGLAAALIIEFIIAIAKASKNKSTKKTLKEEIYTVKFWPAFFRFLAPVAVSVIIAIVVFISSATRTATAPDDYDYSKVVFDFLAQLNISMFGFNFPLAIVLIVPIIIYLLIKNIKSAIMLIISLVTAIALMIFIYSGSAFCAQKASVLLLITLFILWTSSLEIKPTKKTNKLVSIIVAIICAAPFIATIPKTVTSAIEDINNKYSFANDIADHLDGYTDAIYVVAESAPQYYMMAAHAINPDIKVYNTLYANDSDRYKFMVYDSNEIIYSKLRTTAAPSDRVQEAIDSLLNEYEYVYLVTSDYSCSQHRANFNDIVGDNNPTKKIELRDYNVFTDEEKPGILKFYRFTK